MKNLIITILLIFTGLAAKSQTIDTAYKTAVSCKVNPFYNMKGDTAMVSRININSYTGSTYSKSITINYGFYSSLGTLIYNGQVTLFRSDYPTLLSGTLYDLMIKTFQYIGTKAGITYQ